MIYCLGQAKSIKNTLSSPLHSKFKKKKFKELLKDFNTVRTLLKGTCKKDIDLVADD